MTDLDRILAFIDGIDGRSATRIEPFPWGTALISERLPLALYLSFLRLEHGEPDADELAAECERILGGAGVQNRSVKLPERAEGRLAAGFARLGWSLERFVVMVAAREPDRERDLGAVEEIEHDDLRPVWAAGIRSEEVAHDREDIVQQLVEAKRVVAEAVPTRYFAARTGQAIASYCELYSSGGVGQIESVMTLPEHRGRGLAGAVVLRALAASRAGGNDLTFLVAYRDDWPRQLYTRLGFDEIGGFSRFILRKPAS